MISSNPSQPIELKIAYIGGGSREWARKLMLDLALCPDLTGEVALYDIDMASARLNEALGDWLRGQPGVRSSWRFAAVERLEDALARPISWCSRSSPARSNAWPRRSPSRSATGSSFPWVTRRARRDWSRAARRHHLRRLRPSHRRHLPAGVGHQLHQSLGDLYPDADAVAPRLKAFGCCHEVFATQRMLAGLVSRYLPIATPARTEIRVNVTGINHFTWIDRAFYQDVDLLDLLRRHISEPGVLRLYNRERWRVGTTGFTAPTRSSSRSSGVSGSWPPRVTGTWPNFCPDSPTHRRSCFAGASSVRRWPGASAAGRMRRETRDLMAGREPLRLESSGEEGVDRFGPSSASAT